MLVHTTNKIKCYGRKIRDEAIFLHMQEHYICCDWNQVHTHVDIPEAQLNKIFEPFFSAKPTTGTGLGLGIEKRLINLYNGKIQVATKVGKGASFKVILPEG